MTRLLDTPASTTTVFKDGLDGLTGIRNRRGFEAAARELAEACRQTDLALVLVTIELLPADGRDQPSWVADALLRATAGLLATVSRSGDLIGRTNLTQFSLLLPGGSLAAGDQIGSRLTERAQKLSRSGRSEALRSLALRCTSSYFDLDAAAF